MKPNRTMLPPDEGYLQPALVRLGRALSVACFAGSEILLLRHQLNVLRRKSPKRMAFTDVDRLVFARLYHLAPGVLKARCADEAISSNPREHRSEARPWRPASSLRSYLISDRDRQRVIAFFVPERGSCAVNTIMWRDTGADAPYTASRVRLSLQPGGMVRIDDAYMSMNLLCGAGASTLEVVGPPELDTSAAAND
jgi:hypothetical protein